MGYPTTNSLSGVHSCCYHHRLLLFTLIAPELTFAIGDGQQRDRQSSNAFTELFLSDLIATHLQFLDFVEQFGVRIRRQRSKLDNVTIVLELVSELQLIPILSASSKAAHGAVLFFWILFL